MAFNAHLKQVLNFPGDFTGDYPNLPSHSFLSRCRLSSLLQVSSPHGNSTTKAEKGVRLNSHVAQEARVRGMGVKHHSFVPAHPEENL